MSADAPAPPDAEAAPAAGGAKPLPVILAIVAGLALGGSAGAFGVGPALASGIAPSAEVAHAKHHAKKGDAGANAGADDAPTDDEDGGDDAPVENKGGKEGETASVFTIDNLVLNPAGSGGTRFLLLSIAFQMKDAAALEAIKARDAELRDAVLVTLGAKTVEQLSEMSARDSLKVELRSATAKALHTRGIRRVYFPQFVIQ